VADASVIVGGLLVEMFRILRGQGKDFFDRGASVDTSAERKVSLGGALPGTAVRRRRWRRRRATIVSWHSDLPARATRRNAIGNRRLTISAVPPTPAALSPSQMAISRSIFASMGEPTAS